MSSSKVAIQEIKTESTVNADNAEEPCRLGPYHVNAKLVVYASTPEEATRVVAKRIRGEHPDRNPREPRTSAPL